MRHLGGALDALHRRALPAVLLELHRHAHEALEVDDVLEGLDLTDGVQGLEQVDGLQEHQGLAHALSRGFQWQLLEQELRPLAKGGSGEE